MKLLLIFVLVLFSFAARSAPLNLDIISYDSFIQNDPTALATLSQALLKKGIIGICDIPNYSEKIARFVEAARLFSSLPEEEKERCSRKPGEIFLGYELGKEKFKRPDGTWVIDDEKASYYAFIPDCKENKWPDCPDLRTPFQEIGMLMREMGLIVMEKIELIGRATGISFDNEPTCGRMLAYRKTSKTHENNPLWCGAHFDHGLFTVLLPSFYFIDGKPVDEPEEAGLFVRVGSDSVGSGQEFRKVAADPKVMLFQAGEFGQLVTDDAIRATEHRVQKAHAERIERYTMAAFFGAPKETVVFSHSELTDDTRYGAKAGEPCNYGHWHEASFNRYIVE